MRKGNSEDAFTEGMAVLAHSDRIPMLLFMGGGMGAGKSTVLKEGILGNVVANAVVVEADASKETDMIYRALSSKALNDCRDVFMDGTLSWEPFVEQTIAIVRSIHKHHYRVGVGYKVSDDGTITENYWEKVKMEMNLK
nr:hypothetical protein [Tanacetum cinerariifolium]